MNLVTGTNLLVISAFWAISIAYKYAKLWSDGFDWRDVFRQPRDKMIVDVAAETLDDAKAIFDPAKRAEVRERDRMRRLSQGTSPVNGLPAASNASLAAIGNGPHAVTARQAMLDRDEIVRLMSDLPKADAARLPDVVPSARSLAEKVVGLSIALAGVEREIGTTSADAIEKEIVVLESQANPLDRAASESRVRRLATLKRQRRSAAEGAKQQALLAARLESCALALQNMKLDVLRLKTGNQSWQQVTSVAEAAMQLAREVDNQVYVGDEMARLGRSSTRG
jgi:serine/threonine-protein kinase